MKIPITREDFIGEGRKLRSDALVREIDRLLPVARTDAAVLEKHEYTPAMLEQLGGYRDRLAAESGAKQENRNAAKGAEATEQAAITNAKNILRSGAAMATNALAVRVPPEGEKPEDTTKIVHTLSENIGNLTNGVGRNSATLRARLGTLKTILGDAAIAPTPDKVEARSQFIGKLESALGALPTHAETTKERQQDRKTKADDLDEIDGRAYFNLKLLCKTGRAAWLEAGDSTRAAAYQLNNLHPRTRKAKTADAPVGGNA